MAETAGDKRYEFVSEYVLRTLKLKNDKWQKCIGVEDNKILIQEFFDKGDNIALVVGANAAGILTPTYEFPLSGKTKAVYFIKRSRESLLPDTIQNQVIFGDLSYAPLDQMSSLVDDIVVPLLSNDRNHDTWPYVVSGDVLRHVHKLKSNVFVVSGQVKGKTLLPLPPGTDRIPEEAQEDVELKDELIDRQILHTLESVVIEWSHQVRDVLKRDSSEPLLQGHNPLPNAELTFWADRYQNLKCIYDQLKMPKVKTMSEVLKKVQSSYYPAFQQMFKDVVAGLTESQDIHTHLKAIKWIIEDLEEKEFHEYSMYIRPLFTTICKIWAHSKYYSAPTRLIVLLQEISNLVINQCRNYLKPEDLFKGEVDEVIEQVSTAIKVLKEYRDSYQEHKDKLETFFEGMSREPVLWDFDNSLVFARTDRFLQRLENIKSLFVDARDMLKLEKIEFGGVKGSALSGQVVVLFEEFNNLFKIFGELKYDPLDPVDESFNNDLENFREHITDIDRRLGAIVAQSFDDCPSTESAFKLVAMFGSLLERPLILEDMWPRYPILLAMFHKELDEAKAIYDKQMQAGKENEGYYPVNKNMPMVAGAIRWSKELCQRIQNPYGNFRHIQHPIMESDEGNRMEKKYAEMMQLLKSFEESIYAQWTTSVDERSQYNLNQPLITRNSDTNLISVNFNPQLVSVLREVKYLESEETTGIPDEAAKIFSAKESFRQFVANVDLTQQWYNKVRNTILEVEYPLIEGQLVAIDNQLQKAEKDLSWKSEGVWEYIQETRDQVFDLEQRVQKAKDNVDLINKTMTTWILPLFERKDNKKETLLNLDDREDKLTKRYAMIKESAVKIHQLLEDNKTLFKASEDSETWKAYMLYIDDMVIDGCFNAIECSMKFLLEQTDSRHAVTPLFQAQLELHAPDMVFKPSLDYGMGESGFFELIEDLLNDMYNMSSLIPRLTKEGGAEHYQADMEDMADLSDMKNELLERVQTVMDKACEYRNSFDNYAYLWVDDRNEFMKQFLTYGHVLTTEEIEAHAEEGVPENPPTLDMFKEQVDQYEKIYCEVEEINPVAVFDNWFRVDAKPFKQALLNIIKRWSFMFKQHLIDHVTNSLSDLDKFIKVVDRGMSTEITDNLGYDELVTVIGYLRDVKSRQTTTDEMFEPLKQTIELLKTYDQEMPEDTHKQLEQLPEKWNNTKKTAATVKQAVAPLQSNEVAILRRKCSTFDVQQHQFRERFRKDAPFRFISERPYTMLDRCHGQITQMEDEMHELFEAAAIFEINVPDFKQMKQCRREVILLKSLWDMITLVKTSIEDWKKTKWANINVEQMELDAKKFAKDIRALDKEMRAWDSFSGLDSLVKNILTSLRAVSELQNPAIRDRHWQQLMQATQVKFVMDDETTLADLLKLNLHNFEDEVRGIVDKAVKEMGMEKILKELDVTWSAMEFKYDVHGRTKLPLLQSDEELIETLEENQVQLQNLMTSKYIAYFLDQVSGWQKSLSTADSVITIWFEVQRTWSYLEAIFIGSEDIRSQLPEDSKRFEGIDADFKELVAGMEATPNVVKATNKPGLFEQLEELQGRLALCEKALAEYLDTKRLAFPRFYFVSSADLLDILSNGTNPVAVSRHLAKLFDNMAQLKFKQDDAGNPTKTALGMFSKEKEYVEFDSVCECVGPVELWLNKLMEVMRSTVRQQMTEGIVTYEEKPREQWIFDYPAQVSLLGTQIWWTTEVNISFARLEEGYENAMKDYYKKQINQLNTLIGLLIGDLTKNDRQNIMTICTIDVHAKDVVGKLIEQKIDSSQAFLWLSQLRLRWDEKLSHVFANICDAQFKYSYEYLGCTPRLVITPLTDRCYITLTQSLHLTMSGAPAGPAGTGKTETTKDLGRALGIMVYVFNCSEQMDYKSIGNIYKGLAQTGAWGCFDEFNRISVEVLSVVAVQVKTIQDSIREDRKMFDFLGENIRLVKTVGLFITMNPGYAGRTELPENLKALFRPCAMVVPDFAMICEIMLVAEGFIDNRLLARKFITLYTLCRELLSKQDHYDWGLRAIKSVLVVAGALKRSDPGRAEDQVLMRALRDFNIPKIVTDDLPVFMGLIGDLFPALDVPRKRDPEFEKIVKESILNLKLQPEDNFLLKIVQLEELLSVRHSVFVIGNAGTGKSQILKSLNKTYQNQKRKPIWVDLNPKAVTNNELYGVINPATREWKDGLFSTIMRDLSNIQHDGPKWIVLDGDIDPMWIESLNTVMDDNKVLTLASNERIPLTPSMRMLFEISHLKAATPATVSRAGILFVNPADLGWNPPVSSWIDQREVQSERANLTILFDKYVPPILDALKTRFKTIIPIPEQSMIQMLCYLLEVLLTPENTPPDCPKDLYELYFVFACIWAFGGSLFQDQLVDHRVEFSKWWTTEFKTIKFPSHGTVFEYCIDPSTKKFQSWSELVPKFELDTEMPLQAVLVHNSETVSVKYFMDLLMAQLHPVMLVGNAGTGKSVLVNNKLSNLDEEDFVVANVPFNYYTTSQMLQTVLEKPLEKKAGRNYGPPGTKKLVYFIDDINMPEVDKYGTVQPHTLIRQHMDYKHWYDRQKLSLKEIHNVQYVACMNPTAGSFTISSRLQRHFCVFALSFPGKEALKTIYNSIYTQHLKINKFGMAVLKSAGVLIDAALALHQRISQVFLPTAIKFHYVFNLRDLSNIFQGVLYATSDCIKSVTDSVKLWLHEAARVYKDKFVDDKDMSTYDEMSTDIAKKFFDDIAEDQIKPDPHIYCHFATGIGEPKYFPIPTWDALNKLLVEALDNYNEMNAVMSLVLFGDAMAHICRINRIFESPRGNALLVGVGGSGKQSLSRLAAFISNLDVFQITLRKGYGIPDLKVDLGALFVKAGVKNMGVLFLLTDAQVADERFLVLVNDMLSTGEIADLFPDDEIENIINGVRNEVKGAGLVDTRETCWKFFIERVRRNLKVALCFSPVGNTLRVRARKFPGVVNCTAIDWFHEWPKDALESVSMRFLSEIENIEEAERESISQFMSYVHMSVNGQGKDYLVNERRYNYTTPKSFLEQIKLYETLLAKKNAELQASVERLENGLQKLRSTAAQVDDLKAKLAAQEIELKQKNEDADKLIQVVGVETEKVSKEKAIADIEEEKVTAIEIEVTKKKEDCTADLAKAEPALLAAQDALNTLNKNNLTELKSFGSPPGPVVNVVSAVMVLMAPQGKIPKDKSWKACKIMMAKVDQFLDALITYDKENIHENCLKAIRPFLENPEFDAEFIQGKSFAAAGLCAWTVNIVRFYEIFCDVEPKRQALAKATADLQAAQDKLAIIKNKIAVLNANLAELTAQFEEATAAKLKCQQEAEATQMTISLANRLVGGLTSENVRWAQAVQDFREQEKKLTGNTLVVTAFVSYVGYFTKPYRLRLMDELWLPFLKSLKTPIPTTDDMDFVTMLTDEADIAGWNNEGLPSDRMSTENATILTNCQRWPLMVDPQLQGIKWIKKKYGSDLKVIRIGQRGYLDTIENALAVGDAVLIENIEESVDPVLGPLLGRETIKKGRYIKIGDKECEYNQAFRLILHTKLANPHYQPEMQAQCTLINFTVTREGLEDQLLANVVGMERPDLEALKLDLTKQQNDFKITLKRLEDDLLARLSAASGDFLSDTSLVENLENTKKTAHEVEEKVKEAKTTEIQINEAREHYRPAAARASLLYFILNDLNKIHPMYQFSLKSFSIVFEKAVQKAEADDNLKNRVKNLINSITYSAFLYTSRGLFEKHKIIFTAQVAFQVLLVQRLINPIELDFLLRFPSQVNVTSPVDFLSNASWGSIKFLSEMEEFRNLDRDIEGSAKRWKKLAESEAPEKEKLPQEWKNKNALQKLCIMRALRADRMTYAVRDFVEEKLGSEYAETRGIPFEKSYEETGPQTPTFFILSPGVDPLKDVEKLGKKLGFTLDNKKFHNVSLGQGQEVVAEAALDVAAEQGHWVVLQNIHLVAKWLMTLQNKLEKHSVGSHNDFRVFMSAEPASTADSHIIPQGILENSIKITNEPPTGMHSNLHKALDNFNQDTLEMCAREVEFKSILFSLCYFHAVVSERRKFGPQGWNRVYPFNTGDLTISMNVLYNYLEANQKVPWDDLRYLFGEIMYGGHITDDWDRHLCRTYLKEYMNQDMFDNVIYLAPGFPLPPALDYDGYHSYIDDALPPESPYLYGLHPNAEIDFLTTTSDVLFKTILELMPRDSSSGAGSGPTREEKIKQTLDEILEKLPEAFNMTELMSKVEPADRTPYVVVAFQECERMNTLTNELRSSLKTLDLGLKGELTITAAMEALGNSLFLDSVPESWALKAYPSMAGLTIWYVDLLLRIKELENWTSDFQLPAAIWLGGFFNPQSFLTAIMQAMARKNEWPLDKMCLQCDVTKKNKEDFSSSPREGAYIHSLYMEGARWDTQTSLISEGILKDLTPTMPVIFIKAIPVDKQETRNIYACPVYKTKMRGPTFVWTFNLKTKEKPAKWTLGGVAILLMV
ncbi:unnamed protein product [Clavelina lepadiformis]|uniref:AAA+ ATPase domain-containing protein n=1 Tax=Clavelina lepadiformis TaxID=159417 RepID=A0ABP0GSS0_CLALP